MIILMWFSGFIIGVGLSSLAINWMFSNGVYVKVGAFKGWACKYDNSSVVRLYASKEMAELNYYPEDGDRLFRIVEVEE